MLVCMHVYKWHYSLDSPKYTSYNMHTMPTVLLMIGFLSKLWQVVSNPFAMVQQTTK